MKTIRPLEVSARILSEKEHTVRYVASDQTLDCYREIIAARGWRFTNFAKNAPFADSHQYDSIERLLGSVIDFKVSGSELIEDVQWAADVPENKLAVLGWKMTVSGHLKAVSVGFFPVDQVSKYDSQKFNLAAGELKLPAEVLARTETIYLAQEQIELSACIIGANPNALAKAHQDDAITDADLDAVGFTDEDMTFLHESAAIYERISPIARRMLDAELRCIPFRQSKSQTATPADGRAAAGAAEQHEREEFLRKLKAATT